MFKFIWKSEGTRIDKEILKNNMRTGLSLPDTKKFKKVIMIKTVRYQASGTEERAQNRLRQFDYLKIKTKTSVQQKTTYIVSVGTL